ncbi:MULTISPECIES: DmsC/YnfH family molybdoenzyme membrane anchor subunit [unclassified Lysobacter]|uniref:dimethyl sulfoxide reductase anchor subunit family protein n=1 Tax=unclassified Lysobacter TaxID=2635362 RepID=UPI001C2183FC|nr:DmsC/YnfH family molybdoenzyme membrane anchor subunit [Lysobacter sp. MMG2]MBU8975970.1 dimethyl sulfoxide reductase anchor subunit [Lysobacter sp. MMG2]
MHPAFSVLLFTTLSGAGYGLFMWAAALILLPYLQGRPPQQGMMPALWAVLLVPGLMLTTIGLVSSMFHLGKPMRAWRAFSQWRSSWLSREGVFAVATALPAVGVLGFVAAMIATNSYAVLGSIMVPLMAAALLLLSVATVVCTAMIYASLKPIPAWRQALVVPVYLAFAVLSGWLLAMALLTWGALGDEALGVIVLITFVLAFTVAVLKLVYWHRIDRQALGATRGDAVGLPGREIGVFERPSTQDNYINREMGFVLARKHARALRAIALVLFAVVPAVASWLAWAHPDWAGPVFTLGALLTLTGVLVERWLFFAQARHLVTLYY